MPNFSKLDETIDQLEKQAEMLKQNNKVLARVSELSTIIEKGVNELSIGNKNFDGTKKDIQASLKSLNDSVGNLEKQNEKHIEALITSNKKNLREFEDTVSSKLERFSSDIQVSIRQERTQLQEALQNNITSQFNSLESKQKDLFAAQGKQISLLKILIIVIIVLCIGLGIKMFL
ncbi:MAG: hypothetical protein ABI402_05950 [Ferruginibacter sp.]